MTSFGAGARVAMASDRKMTGEVLGGFRGREGAAAEFYVMFDGPTGDVMRLVPGSALIAL